MSKNTSSKREIENLREQLNSIMDKCTPDEALELSEKLDSLIVKYLKSSEHYSRFNAT